MLTVADILLIGPSDVAKKCRVPVKDAECILDVVCSALAKQPRTLEYFDDEEMFTTGDSMLDEAFGGGIRTMMLWEIVGESAAGKTQFALQLSLTVQLPISEGGLSGSACYLTTSSTLPTTRLVEITENHPRLSPAWCSLSDIHTIKTPEIPVLLHVLAHTVPELLTRLSGRPDAKPVKLLVIDTLTELFHSHDKLSSETLFQRSKSLTEISHILHNIASKFRVAVLVLNEVVDVVERHSSTDDGPSGDLIYADQARWFNRAETIPGEGRKQASMGLVWANQVNTRVMLSRTERMRYLEGEEGRKPKRRRSEDPPDRANFEFQPVRIRRLSIIYSSVTIPSSMDYIVSHEGFTALSPSADPHHVALPSIPQTTSGQPNDSIGPDVSLLDVGLVAGEPELDNSQESVVDEAEDGPQRELDVDDEYWKEVDFEGDVYNTVDLSSSAPRSDL